MVYNGSTSPLSLIRAIKSDEYMCYINSVYRGDYHVPSAPSPHFQSYLNESIQQRLIDSNRREYGRLYDLLTFAGPEQLAAAGGA